MVSASTALAMGEEWALKRGFGDVKQITISTFTADTFSAEQNFAELIQSPHPTTLPIFQN